MPGHKRARLALDDAPTKAARDPLFVPFRTLGHVTTSVPVVVQSRSSGALSSGAPAFVVLSSLGSSWALWEGERLTVLFVGPDMGSEITALAMDKESVFAAAGNAVHRYVRGKAVEVFSTAGKPRQANGDADEDSDASSSSGSSSSSMDDAEDMEEEEISKMIIFGTTLVALSSTGRRVWIWDIAPYVKPASNPEASSSTPTTTPYATLELPSDFTATSIVHPATYLNKVVLASQEGSLAIYNIRTLALVHTFPNAFSSPITVVAQSPALDVLAVGCASGETTLFDIRMGEALLRTRIDQPVSPSEQEGNAVTGVAFRDDNEADVMAVTGSRGDVTIFDLRSSTGSITKGGAKVLCVLRRAHEGAVGGIVWLSRQPAFLTCGEDNSLKQWLFDSPTAAPRLLRQRSGHRAPPHLVRYYGSDGKSILSAAAGNDRAVRCTSVVRDSRGFELSQGAVGKKAKASHRDSSEFKLPPVRGLDWSTSRARDWDDLLCVHEGEGAARTWSVHNKRMGKHALKVGGTKSTAACVTACGNFGLVGDDQGVVTLFNMQSGMKRKIYRLPGADGGKRARTVTGIATDALNQTVIVATLAGDLVFFDFQFVKVLHTLRLPGGITGLSLQRDNNLLAVVCDDLAVRIYDIETRKLARELSGFRGAILDYTWSPDSRWFITTSQDAIIRTFDVPTGSLVDAFRTATVATSVTFSPTSDFLATSHVGSVGIHLWANRAQFSEVPLRALEDADLDEVSLPTVQGVAVDASLTSLAAPTTWDLSAAYTTPDQLADELVTLTLLPRSKWQTILNLETIKARNKPTEAPKKDLERAPFFLPTLPGLESRFDLATETAAKKNKEGATESRRIEMKGIGVDTEFTRKLLVAQEQDDHYESFFLYLKSLPPSATDLEFRTLSSLSQFALLIQALTSRLHSRRDFEGVQTWIALLLRVHGDVLKGDAELLDAMKGLQKAQEEESKRVGDRVRSALGRIAFLRGTPVA